MTVQSFTVSPFMSNCYVCHDKGEAVLVDPGMSSDEERETVFTYIEKNDLEMQHLLLTHAHLDHILDCAAVARAFDQQFLVHEADLPLLQAADQQAQMFNVPLSEPPPEPKGFIAEGDTVTFGSAEWKILHCPGHSPGSVVFHDRANGFVISGDVVFKGSVGRTDLWKGSMDQLLISIREKLLPLPDETILYPGHGPETRIGQERTSNPFITDGG